MTIPVDSDAEIRKRRRWRVRRRMAIASFIAGLVFPILCLKNTGLIELAVPFYSFLTSIIIIYIGSAAYDDAHGPQEG